MSRLQDTDENDDESAPSDKRAALPLQLQAVDIDDDCTGSRWKSQDQVQLARLIAIIAMGQAAYAAHILGELLPASPAFSTKDLRQEAIIKLTVQEGKKKPRIGYPRWQRDGFIFEAISWIAAQQEYGDRALLMGPHVSATSHGIDGLMLRLSRDKTKITNTTILEDKCSDEPRKTFLDKVIPAFLEHHQNKRSAEVVAAATVLLQIGGFDTSAAAALAAAVTNKKRRSYRAAFALPEEYDSSKERKRLFKDYDKIDGISAKHRIGASLVVDGDLRDWFDRLACEAITFLTELDVEED
jgi:hypothetical protein